MVWKFSGFESRKDHHHCWSLWPIYLGSTFWVLLFHSPIDNCLLHFLAICHVLSYHLNLCLWCLPLLLLPFTCNLSTLDIGRSKDDDWMEIENDLVPHCEEFWYMVQWLENQKDKNKRENRDVSTKWQIDMQCYMEMTFGDEENASR